MNADQRRLATLLIIAMFLVAACRQRGFTATDIQFEMSVSELIVGETTLLVSIKDEDGNFIQNPGRLSIRGDMDHAGMAPVFARADAPTDGVFTLPFEWTMGGGWIVEASLTLESGEIVKETFEFEILTEAGGAGRPGMDHSAMGGDEEMSGMRGGLMGGESSAVYMRIANRGDAEVTILSAESAAAAQIEFHRSIIENGTARMEAADGLRIPAGATIELEPGGAHIMLMGLTEDLLPDNQIPLNLICDSGQVYALDISIQEMPPSDLDDAVEIGDLVFSNRWARPARGAMGMNPTPIPE